MVFHDRRQERQHNPQSEGGEAEKKADTVEEAAVDAAQDTWRLSDFSQVKGLYMFMATLC